MKKKDFQDFKQKDITNIEKVVREKKQDVLTAKINMAASKEKNLKKVRNIRREISMLKTLIREKQLIQSNTEKSNTE